jgi:DNA modification methylase
MPRIGTTGTVALRPFWQTSDGRHVRLYQGNVTDVLAKLSPKSVHCCVTSPPYWGLRDYGTGKWEGGDPNCDHKKGVVAITGDMPGRRKSTLGHNPEKVSTITAQQDHQFKDECKKCGAVRHDHQLGSEPSPDCGTHGQAQCGRCFVCSMVAVFRGVHRVLRDDGTLWLNLGDSYASGGGGKQGQTGQRANRRHTQERLLNNANIELPSGNLVGIPWRVALALQADGWILRQDIIWSKPAPMPESVKNRCTKSHEYVFLLAKRGGYFYDHEAVREDVKVNSGQNMRSSPHGDMVLERGHRDQVERTYDRVCGANKRSVWTISPQGYEGAHFATFPPKLIEPMIKAGTSEKGCCSKCGAPWKRIVEEKKERTRTGENVKEGTDNVYGDNKKYREVITESVTVGWEPSCECNADVIPCTVLDPFIGSGTTCAVSVELGRSSVGIDLSEKYLTNNAVPRIEGALLRRPDTRQLIGKKPVRMILGKPA